MRSNSLLRAFVLFTMLGSLCGMARGAMPALDGPTSHPPLGIRTAGRATSTVKYVLHDVGKPPENIDGPSGFNNTGQIFGAEIDGNNFDPVHENCYVWTGTAFRRLPLFPAGAPGFLCYSLGMTDANPATGEYEIVGSIGTEFTASSQAFAVIAEPGRFKQAHIYYPYGSSGNFGVNAAQISLAYAGTSSHVRGLRSPLLTGTPATFSLRPVQPASTYESGLPFLSRPYSLLPCPFGGCFINNDNLILGFDGDALAVAKIGSPLTIIDLPFDFHENFELNNADQVLIPSPPSVYDIRTKTTIDIPLRSKSCGDPSAGAIGFNDLNQVLGYVTCVSQPKASSYFLWDKMHGVQKLDPLIPNTSFMVFPLAINNNGQILVKLTDPGTGISDWGTLDPIAPANGRPANGQLKTTLPVRH